MSEEERKALWEAVGVLCEAVDVLLDIHAGVLEKEGVRMRKTRIRRINGPMPFDKDGRHATGREVWAQAAAGNWVWAPEFEGDDTEDMEVTEE